MQERRRFLQACLRLHLCCNTCRSENHYLRKARCIAVRKASSNLPCSKSRCWDDDFPDSKDFLCLTRSSIDYLLLFDSHHRRLRSESFRPGHHWGSTHRCCFPAVHRDNIDCRAGTRRTFGSSMIVDRHGYPSRRNNLLSCRHMGPNARHNKSSLGRRQRRLCGFRCYT